MDNASPATHHDGPLTAGPSRPLAPPDAQFATTSRPPSRPGEAQAGPGARPFGMRFLRVLGTPPSASGPPGARYDHDRQLSVSAGGPTAGQAVYPGRWHHTTTGPSSDGNNTPVEEFNMDK